MNITFNDVFMSFLQDIGLVVNFMAATNDTRRFHNHATSTVHQLKEKTGTFKQRYKKA